MQFNAMSAQFGAQSLLTGSQQRGDYWSETQQFTLDFIIGQDSTPWTAFQPLFGMGITGGDFYSLPFQVCVGADAAHLLFSFRTAEMSRALSATDRQLTIPLAGLTAPYHIKIELDLIAGTIAAYDLTTGSKVLITTILSNGSASTNLSAGNLNFAWNETYPFMIACNGFAGPLGPTNTSTPLVIYGLRYGAGLVDDFNLTTPNPRTIGYLMPIGPTSFGRTVPMGTGANQGASGAVGIWFNCAGLAQQAGPTIYGLTIACMANQGMGIMIGNCISAVIQNCIITNGSQAICAILEDDQLNLYNVTLEGGDCAINCYQQIMNVTGFTITGGGRTIFRSLESDLCFRNGKVCPPSLGAQSMYSGFSSVGGGSAQFDRVYYDMEDQNQGLATFYMEQHYATATQLLITNCDIGGTGNAIPMILLARQNPTDTGIEGWQAGALFVRGLYGVGYSEAVTVTGASGGTVNEPVPATGSFGIDLTW